MSDAPPTAETLHAFDCPLCEGAFEVEAQWLGQTIPCPHCDGEVELPEAVTSESAAPPKPTAPPVLAPAAEPPRKLTPEERAALRRKVNLGLAIAGVVLLILLFVVLAQFG